MCTKEETNLIAEHINVGLPDSKIDYSVAVYSDLLNKHSDFSIYATYALPLARYVVEKTNLNPQNLADKIDVFVQKYIEEDGKDYKVNLTNDIVSKYNKIGNEVLISNESKLAVLACEFIQHEL